MEMLRFTQGDLTASIATDGLRSVTQEGWQCNEFNSLTGAIAYLEARGWSIDTSNFDSI